MMLMVTACLIVLCGCSNHAQADVSLFKFMDSLKNGFRLVSTFLNADQTYVSPILERLGNFHAGKRKSGPEAAIPFFMKLMGLNSTKVEDLAVDGFVFLTHLISETLMNDVFGNDRQQKSSPSFSTSILDFSPFQYIMKQPQVLGLLTQMEDPNLVEFVLDESNRKLRGYPEEDVQCIPLLVCKMNPFVRGMQRSLKFFINKNEKDHCYVGTTGNEKDCQVNIRWEKSGYEDRMFFFVPSLDEVISHGDDCDDRYPKCVY